MLGAGGWTFASSIQGGLQGAYFSPSFHSKTTDRVTDLLLLQDAQAYVQGGVPL